jgi:hypothetical protein
LNVDWTYAGIIWYLKIEHAHLLSHSSLIINSVIRHFTIYSANKAPGIATINSDKYVLTNAHMVCK